MVTDGWPLFSAEQARAADLAAISQGVSGLSLMEAAGKAAWELIRRRFPSTSGIIVVAGAGNNGGDGLVVARLARQHGWNARLLLASSPDRFHGDAALAWEQARTAGIEPIVLTDNGGPPTPEQALTALADGSLLVDAVLGTGVRGKPRGVYRNLIAAINNWRRAGSGRAVVALDVPSGLDPTTGDVADIAVQSDVTVAFGAIKLGLLMGPARRFIGDLQFADIGLPGAALPEPIAYLLLPEQIAARLPIPDYDAHKGSRGRLWILAGSRGMSGAAILAAQAALRCGAGLVHVAVPRDERQLVAAAVPEALTLGLPADNAGRLAAAAGGQFLAAGSAAGAVVIGPGLGRSQEVAAAVRRVLAGTPAPAVIDADGLTALSSAAADRAAAGQFRMAIGADQAARVLTPHPGEAAALLGTSVAAIQRNRPQAARELAAWSGAVTVLKGSRTLIATPEGRLWVNPTGSAALATGGSGDVLAGAIGALLAQGLDPLAAAQVAAFLHGWAGQLLERRLGPTGVVAGDLPMAMARARQRLNVLTPKLREQLLAAAGLYGLARQAGTMTGGG